MKQWLSKLNQPERGESLVSLPVFLALAMVILLLSTMIYSNSLPHSFSFLSAKSDMIRLIMSTVPTGVKWPIYLAFCTGVVTGAWLIIELHIQKKDA